MKKRKERKRANGQNKFRSQGVVFTSAINKDVKEFVGIPSQVSIYRILALLSFFFFLIFPLSFHKIISLDIFFFYFFFLFFFYFFFFYFFIFPVFFFVCLFFFCFFFTYFFFIYHDFFFFFFFFFSIYA